MGGAREEERMGKGRYYTEGRGRGEVHIQKIKRLNNIVDKKRGEV
jgi:hypothetical protein